MNGTNGGRQVAVGDGVSLPRGLAFVQKQKVIDICFGSERRGMCVLAK